jgi:hypothetical protein
VPKRALESQEFVMFPVSHVITIIFAVVISVFVGLIILAWFALLTYAKFLEIKEFFDLNARNEASPVVNVPAKVVAKRNQPAINHRFINYFVAFEFEDGERSEFELQGQEYGVLVEGDAGVLRHQGTRYLGFKRLSTASKIV